MRKLWFNFDAEESIRAAEALRDNLKARANANPEDRELRREALGWEEAVNQLNRDIALDDPALRFHFVNALKLYLPRSIPDIESMDEEERERAALVAEATEAAGFESWTPDEALHAADAQFLLSNYEGAISLYDFAETIGATGLQLWIDRGFAFMQLGEWDKAALDYERAFLAEPGNPLVIVNYASSLSASGRSQPRR